VFPWLWLASLARRYDEHRVLTWPSSIGAGLFLALLYTASPLTTLVLILAVAAGLLVSRGLAAPERRLLLAILGVALAARLVFIAVLLVAGIPHHNDLAVGALAGDDAYYLGRAIRARDILLGFTQAKYDYFVVTDEYGQTSYLGLLTALQLFAGPTPYGMRALNALFFVAGAALLFRVVRPAFGAVPAFAALITLLCVPSLFASSASMLKESLYFLCTSVLLACVIRIARPPGSVAGVTALLIAGACLWLLDDLRRGALILASAGIGLGLLLRLVFHSRRRAMVGSIAAVILIVVAAAQPAVRARALGAVTEAAKTHGGHVFTVGHAYKLLDEGFYRNPAAPSAWPLVLTEAQAARFLVRAAASFLITPLPWNMASLSELAFLPEHLAWYLLLALLPFGITAGWRRDPLVTALLLGFAIPTAAALAVTNGNVGTLLRLRGLVTPYLVWLSVLGLIAVGEALASGRFAVRAPRHGALVPEGAGSR
jgi:hypothetical protein